MHTNVQGSGFRCSYGSVIGLDIYSCILLDESHFHLFPFIFFQYVLPPFFIPATNSDTDYTSSFNVNNNINNHQNYPRYSEGIFHNTASSTTTTSVRNVLLHVTKTLTMFTFIHIIHSVFVSFHQWKNYVSRIVWNIASYLDFNPIVWKCYFKMGLTTFWWTNTWFDHQHHLIL